ncbi:MAG TPA: ABC transporter permease [Gemmatimonadaceae bacterium]|nr:ABC transporter permease [Gemmatimonadaceae bacterium]
MRAAFALIRANFLTQSSYRLSMLISLAGVLGAVVPIYFVANALQGTMANAIRNEGHQYFGFLLLGMVVFSFLPVAITALPTVVASSINNGTLEAVLGTPTKLPALLAGMTGYGFAWTAVRALLTIAAGAVLGAAISVSRLPAAALVLGLIVLSYLPFGLLSAASVLAFRTSSPLGKGVLILSGLLGGVYYPTHVVPSWLQQFTAFIPLTYGLRALRRVLLDRTPLTAVASDVGILLLFTVVLFAISIAAFSAALRYARQQGALSHY